MLLAGEKNDKIVIPDLQRDYCWGSTGTLVDDFMLSLYEHFKHSRTENLLMGLIYGYYESVRPYLQLCDGQQRLTTLYLIMGMICRLTGKSEFRDLLISDFELNEDDCEPRLLYAVRDSSMYFLSDLVCKYFMAEMQDGETPSEVIKAQPWWFSEYSNDPTINNILVALDKIKKKIDLFFSLEKNERISDFGQFLMDKLEFIYYDMGGRKDGEETFVIINTTGEPLTSTENLKPLVVTHDDENNWEKNSEIWETIDNYFWKHRGKDEETSDLGMKEFLRISAAIYSPETAIADYLSREKKDFEFPYTVINMKQIDTVFQNFKKLDSNPSFTEICQKLSLTCSGKFSKQKDLNVYFVILPLIKYLMEHSSAKNIDIKRVYEFLCNITRYTVISSQENQIADAVNVLSELKGNDICGLLDMDAKAHKILTEEELIRLKIYRDNNENRENIEQLFYEMSTRKVLKGKISVIIAWAGCKGSGKFDIAKFASIKDKFKQLFFDYDQTVFDYDQTVSDLTAISFACFVNMDKYPVHMGNDDFSFLYNLDDWHERFFKFGMNELNDDSKQSIDGKRKLPIKLGGYINSLNPDNIVLSQKVIIDDWLDCSDDKGMFYQFVAYFKKVNYWIDNSYNIKFVDVGNWGRTLRVKDPRFVQIIYSANNNYRDIYLYGNAWIESGERQSNWRRIECWKGDYVCLFTDLKDYNVALELRLDETSLGYLCMVKRENGKKELPSFDQVVEYFELKKNGEGATAFCSVYETPALIVEKFKKVRAFIDSEISR